MENACGQIIDNLIMQECGAAAASGTDIHVYLANWADIDHAETDGKLLQSGTSGDSKPILSGFAMKDGKYFYELRTKPRATEGTASFETGTYGGHFNHSVTLRAFTKDQNAKDFMNTLKDARVVVIVENMEMGKGGVNGTVAGGTHYEVYGYDSGLVLSSLEWNTTLTDTVTYTATLGSDDNGKEGQLPLSFFSGTDADTREAIEALLKPEEPKA